MNSKPVFLLLAVFSLVTILSLWSLYVYRFAPLIILVSAAVAYFVFKKTPRDFDFPGISRSGIAGAVLVALLAAYPYIFVHPFIDASADPAAHISSLAIGEKLPLTYAPFSDFEYRYQIGFPLLAKAFIEALSFIPSNTIVWLLGVALAFLSALLVYLASKQLFSSEEAGLFALALFFGSKIVFQNMYWGQYTFMLASVFFLAAFLALCRKSRLAYIFFPMVIVSHPGVAFYAIIFFALWALVFRRHGEVFLLFLSGLLVLPSFFISYIHFISNAGAEELVQVTLPSFVSNLLVFVPWIGVLVFALAVASIVWLAYARKLVDMSLFLAIVFAVSSLLSVYLSASGSILGGRVVELSMLSGLFLSASFLASVAPQGKRFFPVLMLVLLVSLGLFFSSSQLSELRGGTKIDALQVKFAQDFKEFDSGLRKTLFLTKNAGKLAEASGKIPYDVMSKWYLSYDARLTGNDPFRPEAERRHSLAFQAISGNCPECIRSAIGDGAVYVVSQEDYFSGQLGLKKVFESSGYMVFSAQSALESGDAN